MNDLIKILTSNILKWAAAMFCISWIWKILEITFYGDIQPRIVDDLMWILWGVSLIIAYIWGKKS